MRTSTTLALTALLLAVLTTLAPAAAPNRPPVRAVAAPLVPAETPLAVTMTTAPRYLVGAQHAAFPGLAQAPGGQLELFWRQGSDHVASRDGSILTTPLDDVGRAPGAPSTVLSGADYRDPSPSFIDGHAYLTYFTGSAALDAEGALVSVDGGPAVRIDDLPYAAITAPVVELPDGRLGAAFYGKKVGETLNTAFMGWSTNGGVSWTTNRIMNTGVAHDEPWLVVDGNTTHMFARWGGWDSIAVRTSTDSGATWGPVRKVTSNCTGRPTTVATSGVLIMVCRLLPSKSAKVIYSLDHGATWAAGPTALTAPAGSPLGMTYAAMAPVLPGIVYLVVGMEQADGSSALYGTYLAVSVR